MRISHCVELLGFELFLKKGKRWILDASRREYSRRMGWHSNGYPCIGFPDIVESFLSKKLTHSLLYIEGILIEKVKKDSFENWWKNCMKDLSLNNSLKTPATLSRGFDLLHVRIEQVCVLEPRSIERKLATSRLSSFNLYFQLIWYNGMSLSHKAILTLLCNSLIIHISWQLNIFCYLHFGWFVLSWSWRHESTGAKQEQQRS